jgi:tetratricopeptide (TPR) repeat protein
MSEIDQAGMDSAHQCRIAGSYEQARDGYIQLTEAVPGCAEAWWGMGLTIMNMGEFDEAIECLKKAVELEPDNQRYVLDLGKHFTMLGMDDEAKAAFEQVVALDPGSREGGEAATQLTYY